MKVKPAKIFELECDGGRFVYSYWHDGESVIALCSTTWNKKTVPLGVYAKLSEALAATGGLSYIIAAATGRWWSENQSPELQEFDRQMAGKRLFE